METNKILNADILDILFEGKNKEYGAYELRKSYNGRLGKSLLVTGGVIVVLFTMSFVSGKGGKKSIAPISDTVTLVAIEPPKEVAPPTPPKPVVQPPAATRIFVTPKIVPNEQADAPPPEVTTLDSVKIGTVNAQGAADVGIAGPPAAVGDGKGIVEAPKKQDDGDVIFYKVEIESTYPGGGPAWLRYMNKNFVYPPDAQNNGIEGQVMVRFIVDRDGNVSDVEAISGPETGGLREEAVRVIRKSGKWTPAVQNGQHVKSYKNQPVTFKLAE